LVYRSIDVHITISDVDIPVINSAIVIDGVDNQGCSIAKWIYG